MLAGRPQDCQARDRVWYRDVCGHMSASCVHPCRDSAMSGRLFAWGHYRMLAGMAKQTRHRCLGM
jgi:hypothetical protein